MKGIRLACAAACVLLIQPDARAAGLSAAPVPMRAHSRAEVRIAPVVKPAEHPEARPPDYGFRRDFNRDRGDDRGRRNAGAAGIDLGDTIGTATETGGGGADSAMAPLPPLAYLPPLPAYIPSGPRIIEIGGDEHAAHEPSGPKIIYGDSAEPATGGVRIVYGDDPGPRTGGPHIIYADTPN